MLFYLLFCNYTNCNVIVCYIISNKFHPTIQIKNEYVLIQITTKLLIINFNFTETNELKSPKQ